MFLSLEEDFINGFEIRSRREHSFEGYIKYNIIRNEKRYLNN